LWAQVPLPHETSQGPSHEVKQQIPSTQKFDAQSDGPPHEFPAVRLNAAVSVVAFLIVISQVEPTALSQPVQDEKTPLELAVATIWTVVP
jgi:hypothetical protein